MLYSSREGCRIKTVHEVSKLTGVSVRTLHHYDAIGLLKPSRVSDAGYRYYDEAALARLQSILLFRELQFPLREVKMILDRPNFDAQSALTDQIRLLEMQRDRLDAILASAREIQKTGVMTMSFSAFDKKQLDAYAAEAKEKWGNTEAYQAYEKKSADKTDRQQSDMAEGLMTVFARFGTIKSQSASSSEAQTLVSELQKFISDNYYPCGKEILASLGQMYIGDERFRQNIDSRGGEGTAAFASAAIEAYCKK